MGLENLVMKNSHRLLWIEHPEGSEIWYWRDQDTGQWVRH